MRVISHGTTSGPLCTKCLLLAVSLFIGGLLSPAYPQSDLSMGWKATKNLFSFGNRLTAGDAAISGGIVAAGAVAMLFDQDVKNAAKLLRSPVADAVFILDEFYGGAFTLAAVPIPYVIGIANGNDRLKSLGVQLGTACFSTAVIIHGLKVLIGRGRPGKHESHLAFSPFALEWDHTSFPSGHAAWAFCVSAVLAKYKNNLVWKTSWYAVGALASAARIYKNEHWFSDVVVGGVAGYLIGSFVAKQFNASAGNSSVTSTPPPALVLILPL